MPAQFTVHTSAQWVEKNEITNNAIFMCCFTMKGFQKGNSECYNKPATYM